MSDLSSDARAPINLHTIGAHLEELFNGPSSANDRRLCFVLLVAPGADAKLSNLVSNAPRAEVVALLKAYINRSEGS